MPRPDLCHPQVVKALEKAGWTIVSSPFSLETSVNYLYADLQAQRSVEIGDQEIIVVEVKCFTDDDTTMHELYVSIGQYLIYRHVLQINGLTDPIYLAVPTKAFYGIVKEIASPVMVEYRIKLLVIDLEHEEIEQWIE